MVEIHAHDVAVFKNGWKVATVTKPGSMKVASKDGPTDAPYQVGDVVLVDKLGVDRSELIDTASIGEDLRADSLDQVELTMAFEEEFEIEISDAEAEMVVTVGDALALLKRLVPDEPRRAPVAPFEPQAPKPNEAPVPMMLPPAVVKQLLEIHKGFLDTLAAHFGASFGEPGKLPFAKGGVVASSKHDGIECHGLDTPERVCFYEQDFYVLSNFSAFGIVWKGLRFETSEAAYHWEKFDGLGLRHLQDLIREASSAHYAFKLAEGNVLIRRPDWDAVKVDIMREILRAKAAQHEYVRRKLLATGDRELVENSWRDDFWGWGPNRDGKNMLGKLWMEIRAELRSSEVSDG